MAYVVTESCIKCVYTDCVSDCFKVGPNFMVIDPDECIDCGVCMSECPVDALVLDDELAPEQRIYLALNRELARSWASITKPRAPLAEADAWKDVKGKLQFLER
ncbi:MAG: ferredoxin family protein [Massilia sp.]